MPDTVRLPGGEEIPERRQSERREASRLNTVYAAIWALCGALVVLYLFLVLVNALTPSKAPAATIVVLVLAVAWLAHAWRRLYAGGFVDRPDRERRGF